MHMQRAESRPFWLTRLARLSLSLALALGLSMAVMLGLTQLSRAALAAQGESVRTQNSAGIGQIFLGNERLIDLPGVYAGDPLPDPEHGLVAVPTVPTGTQTDAFARIYVVDSTTGQIVAILPGHTPRWEKEGGNLVFVRAAAPGYGRFDPRTAQTTVLSAPPEILAPLRFPPPSSSATSLNAAGIVTYPATIRVIHHAANTCRDVPAGQIDVIPFEDYVARVVPNEVPALWPFHAVAAQAVAARTYGWVQILQKRPDYDVSDWANFQMMCDVRHPASDAAVDATAGLFLSAQDDPDHWPIIAMYSAENGHPTLTNPAVSYLQAVPDLFALGKTRSGHGYGLSQWGAYRRADAGHHYLQILGHYYTGVHVTNGLTPTAMAGALLDPSPPTLPDTNGFLAPGGLYWRAIVPASPISPSLTLTASAGLTAGLHFSQTTGVWQPSISLTEGAVITAQFWLSGTEMERRVLVVDRMPPPAPALTGPLTITQRTLPVTVTVGEADARVGLSSGWLWQGEALSHTAQSGAVISDGAALNGVAWQAQAGVDQPGAWHGPYTDVLPPGQAYRALFRLRAGAPPTSPVTGLVSDTVIARLDVTDEMGQVRLGLRDLRAADFLTGDEYTEIGVDFYVFDWADGLEFRVDWRGNTDLALDQVQIWTLPTTDWQSGPRNFLLPAQEGTHVIHALAFDGADNPSTPVSITVHAVDVAGPIFGWDFSPTVWQTALPAAVSLSVFDEMSGLDAAGGVLHIDGPTGPFSITATLSQPDRPEVAQRIQATVTALADGRYTATFQAGDRAGHMAMSGGDPLWIDTTPPTVTGTVTSTVAGAPMGMANGWYTEPVRVILAGADETSGVWQIHYGVNGGEQQIYAGPVPFGSPGIFAMGYGAVDMAGNESPNRTLTLKIDLAAPTASLSLDQSNPVLVVARWSGADDGAGVVRFEVESRVGTDPWTPLATVPTSGEQPFVVALGTILQVRVRAVDGADRVGAWVSASATGAAQQVYLPGIVR